MAGGTFAPGVDIGQMSFRLCGEGKEILSSCLLAMNCLVSTEVQCSLLLISYKISPSKNTHTHTLSLTLTWLRSMAP